MDAKNVFPMFAATENSTSKNNQILLFFNSISEAPTKEVPKKIHTIPYKKIGYKLPSIK